jgi:hypothetical protein
MGKKLDGQDSIPGKYKRFSLLHCVQTTSGTQPALSNGLCGLGVKLTTHRYLLPCSKMMELYPHYPTCRHGVVRN